MLAPMLVNDAAAHAAIEARDPRFDGLFYTGVVTTGVYCRCVCPARTPKPKNRRFFASAAAAEGQGFRPCMVCRPELAPGLAPVDAPARLAARGLARIEAGALEEQGLEEIAADLGVTGRHLRRVMRETFGASPIDLAQTCRLLAAKRLLAETDLPVTQVAFAAGFRSLRRFNTTVKERYDLTPTQLRGRRGAARAGLLSLELTARGALDAGPTFEFLALRALPGVEVASARGYARTLRLGARAGWLRVAPSPRGLRLTVSEALTPALRPLVVAARGAFDLDADLSVIDARLASSPALAPDVAAEPGVRLPGGLDGFEMAVRAVLGQQVSLASASTLAARLVDRFGEPLATDQPGLDRLFPGADRLADAGAAALAAIGLPRRRAESLRALAEAVARGGLRLDHGALGAREALAALPGFGPWTVEYVALRALGDPDAFPAGDAALRDQLGPDAPTDPWRPWRSYAAVRLWRRPR